MSDTIRCWPAKKYVIRHATPRCRSATRTGPRRAPGRRAPSARCRARRAARCAQERRRSWRRSGHRSTSRPPVPVRRTTRYQRWYRFFLSASVVVASPLRVRVAAARHAAPLLRLGSERRCRRAGLVAAPAGARLGPTGGRARSPAERCAHGGGRCRRRPRGRRPGRPGAPALRAGVSGRLAFAPRRTSTCGGGRSIVRTSRRHLATGTSPITSRVWPSGGPSPSTVHCRATDIVPIDMALSAYLEALRPVDSDSDRGRRRRPMRAVAGLQGTPHRSGAYVHLVRR